MSLFYPLAVCNFNLKDNYISFVLLHKRANKIQFRLTRGLNYQYETPTFTEPNIKKMKRLLVLIVFSGKKDIKWSYILISILILRTSLSQHENYYFSILMTKPIPKIVLSLPVELNLKQNTIVNLRTAQCYWILM